MRAGLWLLLTISPALTGCVTDDDALAKRPRPSGSGGTAGDGGGADAIADAPLPDGDAQAAVDGAADADAHDSALPSGPARLLIVHGIVDRPKVAFCFERIRAAAVTPLGAPQPPEGAEYGRWLSPSTLDGFDSMVDALRVVVLAGDLDMLAGRTCADALGAASNDAGDAKVDAGSDADVDAADAAPRLSAARLPVLPPGALHSGRDLLLVAAGCMGGTGHSDAAEQFICGAGYRPDRPTLTALVAAPSDSSAPAKVSLQFMNGSLATGSVDVLLAPPASTRPIVLAAGVALGAILPAAPLAAHSAAELAATNADSSIEVQLAGSAVLQVPWPSALAQGGLSSLSDGSSFVLVLLGPRPGYSAANWWMSPTVSVVRTRP